MLLWELILSAMGYIQSPIGDIVDKINSHIFMDLQGFFVGADLIGDGLYTVTCR